MRATAGAGDPAYQRMLHQRLDQALESARSQLPCLQIVHPLVGQLGQYAVV